MHKYREGKVKSTAMSGVKQFLKPDAYKQSEPWCQVAVVEQARDGIGRRLGPDIG